MQSKLLFAALAAASLAFPLASGANTGKDKSTQATSTPPAQTASTNGGNDGGAEAMFKSMDKNNDGFISKEEAKGSAHEADFAKLDTNGDGKLSRAEHANAAEHLAAKAKGDKTASSSDTPATKKY